MLNFSANNYLGFADHPGMIKAANDALDTHGFGLASVRFICGTQHLHKQLESTICKFFGTEDTMQRVHPLCRVPPRMSRAASHHSALAPLSSHFLRIDGYTSSFQPRI